MGLSDLSSFDKDSFPKPSPSNTVIVTPFSIATAFQTRINLGLPLSIRSSLTDSFWSSQQPWSCCYSNPLRIGSTNDNNNNTWKINSVRESGYGNDKVLNNKTKQSVPSKGHFVTLTWEKIWRIKRKKWTGICGKKRKEMTENATLFFPSKTF